MRPVQLVGPALFVLGLAVLVVAFFQGQAALALFVVFPVVTATGGWAILGILVMMAGFFLAFITWPMGAASTSPRTADLGPAPQTPSVPGAPAQVVAPQRRWGGVVFLGPIPVVFGSDQKITQWMLVLGLVLFVALVVLTVIALRGI